MNVVKFVKSYTRHSHQLSCSESYLIVPAKETINRLLGHRIGTHWKAVETIKAAGAVGCNAGFLETGRNGLPQLDAQSW
jgi:hypothetical protein